jgi:hypothetical protein
LNLPSDKNRTIRMRRDYARGTAAKRPRRLGALYVSPPRPYQRVERIDVTAERV